MKPRRIWLQIARDDFDNGRDDWGHRDVRMAVHKLSFDHPMGACTEPGEVIATATYFGLRKAGYTPREIADFGWCENSHGSGL